MKTQVDPSDLSENMSSAVAQYWRMRQAQRYRQTESGRRDQGARSATTGGAQMDGFIDLLSDAIRAAGIDDHYIFRKKALELPGYFRPTKEWDLTCHQRWPSDCCD